MRRWLKHQRGTMTLVEMILGMFLLTLILATAYGLLNYGMTAWNGANDRQYLQSYFRLAEQLVRTELRYAYDVQIVDEMPDEVVGEDFFLGLSADGADWVLRRRSSSGDSDVVVGTRSLQGASVALFLEFGVTITSELRATFSGAIRGNSYELSTVALLLNGMPVGAADGVVRYRKQPVQP